MSEQEEVIEVGLRLAEGKLEYFGVDEVNTRIASGKTVKAIEKGRALMAKSGEGSESVRVRFEGFSILVVLIDA